MRRTSGRVRLSPGCPAASELWLDLGHVKAEPWRFTRRSQKHSCFRGWGATRVLVPSILPSSLAREALMMTMPGLRDARPLLPLRRFF